MHRKITFVTIIFWFLLLRISSFNFFSSFLSFKGINSTAFYIKGLYLNNAPKKKIKLTKLKCYINSAFILLFHLLINQQNMMYLIFKINEKLFVKRKSIQIKYLVTSLFKIKLITLKKIIGKLYTYFLKKLQ